MCHPTASLEEVIGMKNWISFEKKDRQDSSNFPSSNICGKTPRLQQPVNIKMTKSEETRREDTQLHTIEKISSPDSFTKSSGALRRKEFTREHLTLHEDIHVMQSSSSGENIHHFLQPFQRADQVQHPNSSSLLHRCSSASSHTTAKFL